MAWSGAAGAQVFARDTGVYTGTTAWAQTDAASRGIRSDDHDTHDQQISDGINACLKKDGNNTASGDLRLGGFKITGLGTPTANTDAATKAYVDGAFGVLVTKTIANANVLTTAASPYSLFTLTGDVLARVFATVQTLLVSTSNNGTLKVGVSGLLDAFLSVATVDGTNFVSGTAWAMGTSGTVTKKAGDIASQGIGVGAGSRDFVLVASSTPIIATIATNSLTAGAMTFYCQYIPLSSGATVVAA